MSVTHILSSYMFHMLSSCTMIACWEGQRLQHAPERATTRNCVWQEKRMWHAAEDPKKKLGIISKTIQTPTDAYEATEPARLLGDRSNCPVKRT